VAHVAGPAAADAARLPTLVAVVARLLMAVAVVVLAGAVAPAADFRSCVVARGTIRNHSSA
jgi:hypothetical protein